MKKEVLRTTKTTFKPVTPLEAKTAVRIQAQPLSDIAEFIGYSILGLYIHLIC